MRAFAIVTQLFTIISFATFLGTDKELDNRKNAENEALKNQIASIRDSSSIAAHHMKTKIDSLVFASHFKTPKKSRVAPHPIPHFQTQTQTMDSITATGKIRYDSSTCSLVVPISNTNREVFLKSNTLVIRHEIHETIKMK